MTVKRLEDIMQRTLEQRCYHTHRSKPVQYKCFSLNLSATSEEETSSIQDPHSSSPYLTLGHTRSKGKVSSRCYSGYCQCKKKRESKSLLLADMKKTSGQRVQRLCESLELQLIDMQLEEALADDKLAALVQHLDLVTSALEAMLQHIQSLQVFHLSAFRVLDISHLLVFANPTVGTHSINSADLTTHLQQVESQKIDRMMILQDLMEHCSKYIVISKRLHTLMDTHRMKKKDFFFAAKNFKSFLDSSKLSMSQIERLYQQYNDILNDYQRSRHVLDMELPKIINIRLEALRETIRKIAEFYVNGDYIKEVAVLFQIIGDSLYQDHAVKEHTVPKDSQDLPICQKCKVNCVDEK